MASVAEREDTRRRTRFAPVKILGLTVAVVVGALVLFVVYARVFGFNPGTTTPGLWLKGELVAEPVTDWDAVRETPAQCCSVPRVVCTFHRALGDHGAMALQGAAVLRVRLPRRASHCRTAATGIGTSLPIRACAFGSATSCSTGN